MRPCDVCGHSRDAGVFLELSTCAVIRCRGCGFVFLDGERSGETEHGLYRSDHFDDGYMQRLDIEGIVAEQVESVELILGQDDRSLAGIPPGTPILDVGCARGHFLHALSAGGRGTAGLVGIDLSPGMVEHGREEFGLDLRCGPVEEVDLPADHFGLVAVLDVLEHVPAPRAVLARLFSCLRPGGWLVVEVPSETTVFRKLARWGFRATGGRLRGPLEQLYHRAHLSYFTRRSLGRLIDAVGGERTVMTTKEAHVTRFGARSYSVAKQVLIRLVCGVDRALGAQAKLLAGFRRPEG